MDRLKDWLKRHNLKKYICKFEEYGWDDISLLYDMTETDIETCIQKPGHKAKFKKALKRGIEGKSVATQTDKAIESYQEIEHSKLAEKIVARITADLNISEIMKVAVEETINCFHNESDKTVIDTVKLESDTRMTNTVTCSTLNESDKLDREEVRLKSGIDETCIEKVKIHPDNAGELKGTETVLKLPFNTLPCDMIKTAEETQVWHLTDSRYHEAESSNSAMQPKVGHENLCKADMESEAKYECQSEGKPERQFQGESEGQSEEQSEGVSGRQFEGQSEGQYEREDILEDCDQES